MNIEFNCARNYKTFVKCNHYKMIGKQFYKSNSLIINKV